jgi:RES domain-containing protein
MRPPKLVKIDQSGTHRLIPYHYSDLGRPILDRLAQGDDELLNGLTELEGATNDRLVGESGRLPGISTMELVSGFRFAHIVNASFTHANPNGGRFNGSDRGAWYASFEMETAQAEVAFHRANWLKEVDWEEKETHDYLDYLADFRHEFHDIREDRSFASCLDSKSYAASQGLGRHLLNTGSAGIVYPSVKRDGGVCIVCFRPPLVLNVRQGQTVSFSFANGELAGVRVKN